MNLFRKTALAALAVGSFLKADYSLAASAPEKETVMDIDSGKIISGPGKKEDQNVPVSSTKIEIPAPKKNVKKARIKLKSATPFIDSYFANAQLYGGISNTNASALSDQGTEVLPLAYSESSIDSRVRTALGLNFKRNNSLSIPFEFTSSNLSRDNSVDGLKVGSEKDSITDVLFGLEYGRRITGKTAAHTFSFGLGKNIFSRNLDITQDIIKSTQKDSASGLAAIARYNLSVNDLGEITLEYIGESGSGTTHTDSFDTTTTPPTPIMPNGMGDKLTRTSNQLRLRYMIPIKNWKAGIESRLETVSEKSYGSSIKYTNAAVELLALSPEVYHTRAGAYLGAEKTLSGDFSALNQREVNVNRIYGGLVLAPGFLSGRKNAIKYAQSGTKYEGSAQLTPAASSSTLSTSTPSATYNTASQTPAKAAAKKSAPKSKSKAPKKVSGKK